MSARTLDDYAADEYAAFDAKKHWGFYLFCVLILWLPASQAVSNLMVPEISRTALGLAWVVYFTVVVSVMVVVILSVLFSSARYLVMNKDGFSVRLGPFTQAFAWDDCCQFRVHTQNFLGVKVSEGVAFKMRGRSRVRSFPTTAEMSAVELASMMNQLRLGYARESELKSDGWEPRGSAVSLNLKTVKLAVLKKETRARYFRVGVYTLAFFAATYIVGVRRFDNNCWKTEGRTQVEACTRIIDSGFLYGFLFANDKFVGAMLANRGNAYLEMGKPELAGANFDRAIEIDPERASNFYSRGKFFTKTMRYDLALADFNRAFSLKYALPQQLYHSRGNAYFGLDQFDNAITDYGAAISFDPRYVWAFEGRGLAYGKMGRFDDAIADFSQAIVLRPKWARIYEMRANVYKLKGELGLALADYEASFEYGRRSHVKKMQRRLKNHGLYDGHIDGRYGPAVKDALKACISDPACGLSG